MRDRFVGVDVASTSVSDDETDGTGKEYDAAAGALACVERARALRREALVPLADHLCPLNLRRCMTGGGAGLYGSVTEPSEGGSCGFSILAGDTSVSSVRKTSSESMSRALSKDSTCGSSKSVSGR